MHLNILHTFQINLLLLPTLFYALKVDCRHERKREIDIFMLFHYRG